MLAIRQHFKERNMSGSKCSKFNLNILGDHAFSTYAKFSIKLAFLTPLIYTRTCAYQGVKNEWSRNNSHGHKKDHFKFLELRPKNETI